jgi:putative tricarboxylic transport membrane protein
MLVPDGTSVISPQTFSYVIGIFLSIVSVTLFITVLKGDSGTPEGTEPGDPFQPADFATMAQVSGAIAAFVVLLDQAGFIVAATSSFFGVSYAFGARKYVKDFFVAVIFAIVVYVAFTKGLKINLPAGIFDGISENLKSILPARISVIIIGK